MASSVGLLTGGEASLLAGQIISARRRVTVDVNASTDADAITLALIHPDVPADGDSYNASNPDVRAVRSEAVLLSVKQDGRPLVQVDVFYEWLPLSGVIWDGGAGVEAVRTYEDNDGNKLEIGPTGEKQTIEAAVQRPTSNATIMLASATPITSFAANYAGRTNGRQWYSGGIGTWFCQGVRFARKTQVVNLRVGINLMFFDMHHRDEGWKDDYAFYDAAIGKIPDGLGGDTLKTFDLTRGTADFNDLAPAVF